jgi:hypothetical protein
MESQEPRLKIFAERCGLVDFSRLACEWVVRLNEIEREQGVFSAIEMLDAFRYGKISQPSVGW